MQAVASVTVVDQQQQQQPVVMSLSLESSVKEELKALAEGLPLLELLPPPPAGRDGSVPHAPNRTPALTAAERKRALANALRYFPPALHPTLAPEFAQELDTFGHIYMYRFRPTAYPMRAYPITLYPARSRQGKSSITHIHTTPPCLLPLTLLQPRRS